MSLFSVREWWGARLGDAREEFDRGALCVANIDDEPSGQGAFVWGAVFALLSLCAHCCARACAPRALLRMT